MQNSTIESVEKKYQVKRPKFRVGDRVTVQVRLKEGDKERLQAFRGVIISKQPKSGRGPRATFTVRKISEGVGVERIFPLHSPFIDSISIEGSSETRRSRLYYLRGLKGKKARLKEGEHFADMVAPEEAAPAGETLTAAPEGTEITGGDAPTTGTPKEPNPKK